MKPTKEQTSYIKEKFKIIQTHDDLLDLLNYTKPILYGEKSIPFKLADITFHRNPKRTNSEWAFFNQYVDFEIKKKSGGVRKIHAPKKD